MTHLPKYIVQSPHWVPEHAPDARAQQQQQFQQGRPICEPEKALKTRLTAFFLQLRPFETGTYVEATAAGFSA